MFNRHGKTNDMLGVLEPMEESDTEGHGLNVSASFTLTFTKSHTEAQNLILKKQNMNMSPLQYFYAISDSKTIDSTFPSAIYIQKLDVKASNLKSLQDLVSESYILSLSLLPSSDLKTLQLLTTSLTPISNITALLSSLGFYQSLNLPHLSSTQSSLLNGMKGSDTLSEESSLKVQSFIVPT